MFLTVILTPSLNMCFGTKKYCSTTGNKATFVQCSFGVVLRTKPRHLGIVVSAVVVLMAGMIGTTL